jgi:hypothetical protein
VYPDRVQCGTCCNVEPRPSWLLASGDLFVLGSVGSAGVDPTNTALSAARFRVWGTAEPIVAGFWHERLTPLLTSRALTQLGLVFDDALGLFFHPEGYVAGRPTDIRSGEDELFEATGAQLVAYEDGLAREHAADLLAVAERLISALEAFGRMGPEDIELVRCALGKAYPEPGSIETRDTGLGTRWI